jgi:hypothetical protein
MSQKIRTPLGVFNSFSSCCTYIMQTNAPAFIIQHPGYNIPYTGACRHRYNNNSAQHYVYHAIKKLCDEPTITDWVRV